MIQESLTSAGFEPLGFFSFLPVGIICIAVGIVVMLPLTRLFLYKKKGGGTGKNSGGKTLDELVDEYQLANGLRRYVVKEQSAVKNKTVAELNLRSRYGLSIIEIRSESTDRSGLIRNVRQSLAGSTASCRQATSYI